MMAGLLFYVDFLKVAQLAQALRTGWNELDWPRLEYLARWRGALPSGIVALEPGSGGREERIVTRWGLRINVAESWLPGEVNRDWRSRSATPGRALAGGPKGDKKWTLKHWPSKSFPF